MNAFWASFALSFAIQEALNLANLVVNASNLSPEKKAALELIIQGSTAFLQAK